jgi:parvulin-like peptidyl-prolyl isomerase
MEMKTRLPFLLLSVVLAATLAACGGGGNSGPVPADAIAQVGSTPIPKASFNSLMNLACANYKAQGQPCKVGTPTYSALRASAVNYLVQQEELAQEASQKLGVTVTQQDLDKRIEMIKKLHYHGSEKNFESALKQQGISLSDYELELRYQLLGLMAITKVARQYYNQHKASFATPKTREVRHILVKSKTLAQKLEQEVKNGANFAKLAKKYSKDTGSAALGGKLCVAHGSASGLCNPTVAPFDKAAFSLKTNDVSLVHSIYGWHVLQPIGAVNPGHIETFAEIKSQIQTSQPPQQVTTVWDTWLAQMANDYKGKVNYQTGYEPPTTTTPTAPAPTTTG